MPDIQIKNLIKKEVKRQQLCLNLIASENYASPEILRVLGSPLVNKYSEGYPGKRYYPGNELYDEIENLAKARALKAFGLSAGSWAVNVQPYSGSPANFAIYSALMNPGDTLMGLELAAGGHLTHGHKVSLSGKLYEAVQYGVEDSGLIDYEKVAYLARRYRPKVIVSGLTAYPRKIDFLRFGRIAKSVGAYHVADISHLAGLIAAGLHQSPFQHSDVVMTTTHKTLRGPRGAVIFAKRKVKNEKGKAISNLIDRAVFPGLQGGPHNNVTAAKAVMFSDVSSLKFKSYQRQVLKNAQFLAKQLKGRGFNLVTGGTDNHLILLDLKNNKLEGLTAEKMLEISNITANRNSVPGDASPLKPSGVRIGTPAVTARGMKEKEMAEVAELISRCLLKRENVKRETEKLCRRFPLPY